MPELSGQDAISLRVFMLDMGTTKYGDCLVCLHNETSILIDGGHPGDYRDRSRSPSIPRQLDEILGHGPPFDFSLLVVTHCHQDHIGCLPRLIGNGTITAQRALLADEDYGWGRLGDAHDDAMDSAIGASSDEARALLAALREESHAELDDDELREFLADAMTLEDRYIGMISDLETNGTEIYRYGYDDIDQLVDEFQTIGLRVLGPSREHILTCARAIRQSMQDSLAALNQLSANDIARRPLELYRQMANQATDALGSDAGRVGAALNNQSTVIELAVGNRSVLLPGDMQFADPSVNGVEQSIRRLREEISSRGPYDFVKIGHHTSHNAMDDEVLAEIDGVTVLGHSGGLNDASHPSSDVLSLLRRHRNDFRFCRTDRNGLTEIRLSPSRVSVHKSRGRLNDYSRNRRRRARCRRDVTPRRELTPTLLGVGQATVSSDSVEVSARFPHVDTRVTLTIDVEPGEPAAVQVGPATERVTELERRSSEPRRTSTLPTLQIAPDRDLPNLLFVTNQATLARNLGQTEAEHTIRELQRHDLEVLDINADDTTPVGEVAAQVRQRVLASEEVVEGVVILGGYDVVPAQRLDVLDPETRNQVNVTYDSDRFVVWSDDLYGCIDDDDFPDVPVSRIPDGRSPALVFAALQARRVPPTNGNGGHSKFGVRNVARPYAGLVFEYVPGVGQILVSEPTTDEDISPQATAVDLTYHLLHGSDADASSFWGESPSGPITAFTLDDIAEDGSRVIFTGCCWGALTARQTAFRTQPGHRPKCRTPDESIALGYLDAGALAFVGCTGTHYSPTQEPFGYYGQPMHDAFWELLTDGMAPAECLLGAKLRYLEGFPYRSDGAFDQAIEMKILRQFTCLGLGW